MIRPEGAKIIGSNEAFSFGVENSLQKIMKLLFKLGVWKASIKSRMAAIERQVFIANGNKKISCGCLSR